MAYPPILFKANFGEISPTAKGGEADPRKGVILGSGDFCKAKKSVEISPKANRLLVDPPASFIMYYVYILLNEAKTRTYTGVTDDVNKRLAEHNAGKVKSSQPYRPYKVIHIESFETLSEARRKEKYYKSATGRRKLKEMLFEA